MHRGIMGRGKVLSPSYRTQNNLHLYIAPIITR